MSFRLKFLACAVGLVALVGNGAAAAKPVSTSNPAPTQAAEQAPPAPQPTAAPAAPVPAPPRAPERPAPPPAPEQTPIGADLDKASAVLKQVEASLKNRNLSDAALQDLRQQLDPISVSANGAIQRLTPRIAAIQTRLDQLGPKPDDDSTPESAAVTQERTDQQKSLKDAQELLKRARLLSVQTEQIDTFIKARRRDLFTRSLFEQAPSIATPTLWADVYREAPAYASEVRQEVSDWINGINSRLHDRRSWFFWGGLALVFLLYAPFLWLGRSMFARSEALENPSPFLKILGAWWTVFKLVLPAVAVIYLARLLFEAFGLSNERMQPLAQALGGGLIRVTLAAGIVRGLAAPTRPHWRLLKLGDAISETIVRLAISLALVVSLTRIFEAWNDIVGASLAFSVALRSLGVLLAAVTLGVGLWALAGEAENDECLGPQVRAQRDWFGLWRIFAWVVTFVVIAAVLTGYASFGSFLIDQLVWVCGVAAMLYMTTALTDDAIALAFQPSTRLGHLLTTSIGLHRESVDLLGALFSGLVKLALIVFATFLVLAPWGLQSTDVPIDVRAAFFGFKVGDVTVSLSSIIVAVGIFSLAYALMHAVQQWIDGSILPHTSLDAGLRNSIKTSFGYVGFLVAGSFALSYLGLSIERLAIVAGALSVGIGFGLQSIVNNFVSGLILLWERAVRVGDWIVVGSDQGYVRRINIRSTEIETFDRSQVIIPNSNLVSGIVKNLVRNDRSGRLVIPLTVAGSADPDKVREVLIAAAKAHDLVLKIPAPQILFTGMSGAELNFELSLFVGEVESLLRVRSDLHFAIYEKFKAEGFFDAGPVAPTKIEIARFEGLEQIYRPEQPEPERRAASR